MAKYTKPKPRPKPKRIPSETKEALAEDLSQAKRLKNTQDIWDEIYK